MHSPDTRDAAGGSLVMDASRTSREPAPTTGATMRTPLGDGGGVKDNDARALVGVVSVASRCASIAWKLLLHRVVLLISQARPTLTCRGVTGGSASHVDDADRDEQLARKLHTELNARTARRARGVCAVAMDDDGELAQPTVARPAANDREDDTDGDSGTRPPSNDGDGNGSVTGGDAPAIGNLGVSGRTTTPPGNADHGDGARGTADGIFIDDATKLTPTQRDETKALLLDCFPETVDGQNVGHLHRDLFDCLLRRNAKWRGFRNFAKSQYDPLVAPESSSTPLGAKFATVRVITNGELAAAACLRYECIAAWCGIISSTSLKNRLS